MFWKVAGTTEIHFRILSNRRYCKSNPSRTANKNLFGKHSFHENTKNLLDKIPLKKFPWKNPKIPVTWAVTNRQIPVTRAVTSRQVPVTRAVTNLQNFTLGLSPKKRDPQKSKGVHKKEGPSKKKPKGRDPREVPIGPQGSPTKSPIYPHGSLPGSKKLKLPGSKKLNLPGFNKQFFLKGEA